MLWTTLSINNPYSSRDVAIYRRHRWPLVQLRPRFCETYWGDLDSTARESSHILDASSFRIKRSRRITSTRFLSCTTISYIDSITRTSAKNARDADHADKVGMAHYKRAEVAQRISILIEEIIVASVTDQQVKHHCGECVRKCGLGIESQSVWGPPTWYGRCSCTKNTR